MILPNSLVVVGYSAFSHLYKLAGVQIGSNLIVISDSMFSQSTKLKTIIYHNENNIGIIGDSVFSYCSYAKIIWKLSKILQILNVKNCLNIKIYMKYII